MLKIFLFALIVYSVQSWEARSWTGRDWQSNSGGNWGWGLNRGGWGGNNGGGNGNNGGGWGKNDGGWGGNNGGWNGNNGGGWGGNNGGGWGGNNGGWNGNNGGGWGKNDGGNGGGGWDEGKDQWAPAKYEFNYGVSDQKTGDNKEQSEERIKDRVVGQYSLKEPDGTVRIVKYEADDKNGFNAKVIREGNAWHPAGARGWKGDGDGKW